MGEEKKLGLFTLIALVVGSMIGGGAFNLASDMAKGAGAGAIIIGWIITGIGMVSLGLAFQNLTVKRPDLDGGIFSYAKAGFGNFMGFNSAWGYWLSAWLGNVAYGTLLFASIGYFFPVFEGGQNVASIIGASILLWCVHMLILRGVQSAALVNLVTTIAKLVPVFVFIVVGIFAFHIDVFLDGFWGQGATFSWADVGSQVKSTMLVTLWVFIGVEGAVVLSSRAKSRSDVGKATVIGLIGTLIIYILLTLLSLGIMKQADVANLKSPAMAYLFESVVGKWGAIFINLGLIISVLGAWLGWTLLASEIPYLAAKDGVFPKWFAKENKNKAPVNSLWLTNGLIQIFLLTFVVSDQAYHFAFSLASSAILVPYAFSAFYQFKYSLQSQEKDRTKNIVIGLVASMYGVWLIYAAGLDYLLLTMTLYAPGIFIFYKVQKQTNSKQIFTRVELISSIVIGALALVAMYQLATGGITL
ncbi:MULTISPECIES: arginine-ornithine antiporter [unclassified Bacillus (in: firmicutes)]|uniref:arginine-ornithine antiporter n=1 Tax=unclassified Bacillus (in: firmicutes) TaxID=185979 RepID=UPI0008F355D1|nr:MULTISPECIES: arginine-ornithine antiporter [unclassified Bacillus (in: firmicutes)]SFJ61161.1 arginine:ornithine antiporter, APA family [Bacillus sp. 71mf]SFT19732.1 arginine:ornithine antiporter, APA family [Bacillus sp. 103mf]